MSGTGNELTPTDMYDQQAYHLKLGGLSIPEIADKLEITETQAVEAYNRYRLRVASYSMDRDEVKQLLLARYETLFSVNWEMALQGDEESTKTAMTILRDEMKLNQLDQIDPADRNVTQNILVIGDDKKSFIEALQQGRQPVAVDEKIDEEEDVYE